MVKNEIDKLSASFRSDKTERLYRNTFLSVDRKQTIIGLLLFCLPLIIFIYSDYLLFGYSREFYFLFVARSLVLIFVALTVYFLTRTKNIQFRDYLVFSCVMFTVCVVLYINLTRPPDYLQNSTLNILIVFSLYWLIPNRYIMQLISAFTISLFYIYIFVFHKDSQNLLSNIIFWFSYIFVNIGGPWISWNLHIYRRRQFATQLEQIAITEKLQYANSEIRTLQATLPLCSGCKRIRDDKGYWSQIDAYIENNTETQFSHGMCLSCVEKLYGEQEWYKRKQQKPEDFTKYSS